MKRIYILAIVTLALLIGLGVNSTRALVWEEGDVNSYKSGNLLRLHILANSSSPEDQYIKRQIRDLIVQETGIFFQNVDSAEGAMEVTSTNLPNLQRKIEDYLSSHGKKMTVALEMGRFDFPTRTYGNLTLPAGEYQALRVTLGKGLGNNWWCVLFPPLCLEHEEQKEEPGTEELMTLAFSKDVDYEVEYRFKFLETLGKIPVWVKANYERLFRVEASIGE